MKTVQGKNQPQPLTLEVGAGVFPCTVLFAGFRQCILEIGAAGFFPSIQIYNFDPRGPGGQGNPHEI